MPRLFTRLIALAFIGLSAIIGDARAEGDEAPEPRFTVGFAQDNMANDWRAAQVRAVRDSLAWRSDIRFIATDARGSTAQNIMDIEDMASTGIDLLVVSPRDKAAMGPVISAIHAKGIPVVLLTRRIDGDAYTTFIGPDDHDIARRAAGFIGEKLGGEGRILVLQGVPTATTAIARTEGFLEGVKASPGLKIAAVEPANYLRANAIAAVEKTLGAGIAFDAIYAQSDSMAEGARMALAAHGHDATRILTVGIDYIPSAREAIRSGEQAASFTYPTCGTEAGKVILDILEGRPVPREITVESTMVTKENVDSVPTIF